MRCTIVGWLPVFTRPEAAEIVFNSWLYLQREKQFKLFGYVDDPLHWRWSSARNICEATGDD